MDADYDRNPGDRRGAEAESAQESTPGQMPTASSATISK
jgi:hypothetical protein